MHPTKAWAIIHDQDDGIAYRFFRDRDAADWEASYSPKHYEIKPVLIVDPETHVAISKDDFESLMAMAEATDDEDGKLWWRLREANTEAKDGGD